MQNLIVVKNFAYLLVQLNTDIPMCHGDKHHNIQSELLYFMLNILDYAKSGIDVENGMFSSFTSNDYATVTIISP